MKTDINIKVHNAPVTDPLDDGREWLAKLFNQELVSIINMRKRRNTGCGKMRKLQLAVNEISSKLREVGLFSARGTVTCLVTSANTTLTVDLTLFQLSEAGRLKKLVDGIGSLLAEKEEDLVAGGGAEIRLTQKFSYDWGNPSPER